MTERQLTGPEPTNACSEPRSEQAFRVERTTGFEPATLTSVERDILFGLYGIERIVVADGGADQVVRSIRSTDWRRRDMHRPTTMSMSMRQSANLVDFATTFAEYFDLEWEVEPNNDLNGGKVDIYVGDVSPAAVAELRDRTVQAGCIGYDVLCLAPTSRTKVQASKRVFTDGWKWREHGLAYWDGLDQAERRDRFSADNDAIRVLPYESCRGLEGWSVICLDFDAFFEGHRRLYRPDETQLFPRPNADLVAAARCWGCAPVLGGAILGGYASVA